MQSSKAVLVEAKGTETETLANQVIVYPNLEGLSLPNSAMRGVASEPIVRPIQKVGSTTNKQDVQTLRSLVKEFLDSKGKDSISDLSSEEMKIFIELVDSNLDADVEILEANNNKSLKKITNDEEDFSCVTPITEELHKPRSQTYWGDTNEIKVIKEVEIYRSSINKLLGNKGELNSNSVVNLVQELEFFPRSVVEKGQISSFRDILINQYNTEIAELVKNKGVESESELATNDLREFYSTENMWSRIRSSTEILEQRQSETNLNAVNNVIHEVPKSSESAKEDFSYGTALTGVGVALAAILTLSFRDKISEMLSRIRQ